MEFGSCDDLSEFLHVSGLDVYNIYVDQTSKYEDRCSIIEEQKRTEALIADVQIPEVDP